MELKGPFTSSTTAQLISIRCPSCRQIGVFVPLPTIADAFIAGKYAAGTRQCPDAKCRAIVFVVLESNKLVASHPQETIDFDSTSLPAGVRSSLEEAIKCHSYGCFTAAAIMIRKTLELLCRDRGATGDNLKARIASLSTKLVLPKELLDALDDLRLLGNDAAHVESMVYDAVGKQEVEVGLAVAKEVLKGVYQYSTLLGQLRALKKS